MAGGEIMAAQPSLPGLVLRAAREAKGLSLNDVAQVTRLSERQIDALERDDYASLPGSTAVRGFVRSYAKLLKLDVAPLLAALDPAAPLIVAEVRPPGQVDEVRAHRVVKLPRKLLLLSWSLLCIALTWYVVRPDMTGLREYFSTFFFVSKHAPLTAVPAIAAAAPVVVPVATPAIPPPATTGESAVALPASADASSVSTPEPAPAAPVPSGMRLEFTGLSWIEVRDATQQIVFSGEYPAGTRQDVAGRTPFQVWIGKASNVRVFFGDRPIDLQPYTRAEVARLTVE
jgi:cytoskeleton protein RodZ